eukprot:scaffold6716_cov114-Isochrysis_galbana.AAC.4
MPRHAAEMLRLTQYPRVHAATGSGARPVKVPRVRSASTGSKTGRGRGGGTAPSRRQELADRPHRRSRAFRRRAASSGLTSGRPNRPPRSRPARPRRLRRHWVPKRRRRAARAAAAARGRHTVGTCSHSQDVPHLRPSAIPPPPPAPRGYRRSRSHHLRPPPAGAPACRGRRRWCAAPEARGERVIGRVRGVEGAETFQLRGDSKRELRCEVPLADDGAWDPTVPEVALDVRRGDMVPSISSACWYQPSVSASGLQPVSCSWAKTPRAHEPSWARMHAWSSACCADCGGVTPRPCSRRKQPTAAPTASAGDGCRSMASEKTMQKAACSSPAVRRAHSDCDGSGLAAMGNGETYGVRGAFPRWYHLRPGPGSRRSCRSRASSAAASARVATLSSLDGVTGSKDAPNSYCEPSVGDATGIQGRAAAGRAAGDGGAVTPSPFTAAMMATASAAACRLSGGIGMFPGSSVRSSAIGMELDLRWSGAGLLCGPDAPLLSCKGLGSGRWAGPVEERAEAVPVLSHIRCSPLSAPTGAGGRPGVACRLPGPWAPAWARAGDGERERGEEERSDPRPAAPVASEANSIGAAAKLKGGMERGCGMRSGRRRGHRSLGPKVAPSSAGCGGGTWYTRLRAGAAGSAGREIVSPGGAAAHWSAKWSKSTYSGAREEKEVRCSMKRAKACVCCMWPRRQASTGDREARTAEQQREEGSKSVPNDGALGGRDGVGDLALFRVWVQQPNGEGGVRGVQLRWEGRRVADFVCRARVMKRCRLRPEGLESREKKVRVRQRRQRGTRLWNDQRAVVKVCDEGVLRQERWERTRRGVVGGGMHATDEWDGRLEHFDQEPGQQRDVDALPAKRPEQRKERLSRCRQLR